MKVNIYFATYDTSLFIIPFVSYLWNKYYNSGELIFMGYKEPEVELNENTKFVSLNPTRESFQYWSHYIYKYLLTIPDDFIIFTVDDTTIVNTSDEEMLQYAINYMKNNPDVSHCYGTACSSTRYNFHCDNDKIIIDQPDYFIFEADKNRAHLVNLQVNIWRKSILIELLKDKKWNTYDFEIQGTKLMKQMKQYRQIGIHRKVQNRWHKGIFRSTCGHLVSDKYHKGKYNIFGTQSDDLEYGKLLMPSFMVENLINEPFTKNWTEEEKGQP